MCQELFGPPEIRIVEESTGTNKLNRNLAPRHTFSLIPVLNVIFLIKMCLPLKLTDAFQQTMLCLLPLFHIYSMNVTMSPALRTGAKLLMLPKFEPNSFIKAIEDHKVNNI